MRRMSVPDIPTQSMTAKTTLPRPLESSRQITRTAWSSMTPLIILGG